jgi:predicted RNA methylase
MFDLLALPPVTDHSAAACIAGLLASGTPIARRDLNEAMTAAFGGSDADGHWTQRDSFEMLEHGIALHLASRPYQLNGMADVAQASAVMAMLPTQTVRSEEQIDLQQFSTPVDIAAIAVLMAAIDADDVVLEPSAGNGLLIVQAPTCASLQLNEIDTKRRERLAGLFPDAIVTGHDGAALVSLHARLPKPTVVVMNPPFSRSVGRGADDLAALRHLQAAIRRVAKGGRVVAIMPDWFAPSARLKAAYETVLTGCTVRTSLRLEHCYRKHGTDIAVRLYVIDKVAGGTSHTAIQRSSVAGFLDAVTIPPRASLVADTPIAALPVPKPSLLARRGRPRLLLPARIMHRCATTSCRSVTEP